MEKVGHKSSCVREHLEDQTNKNHFNGGCHSSSICTEPHVQIPTKLSIPYCKQWRGRWGPVNIANSYGDQCHYLETLESQ